jgi:hypothetical protein
VEAWQHVKLTGTNRSIGFIALIVNHHENQQTIQADNKTRPEDQPNPF